MRPAMLCAAALALPGLLSGCLVWESTYELEVARADRLEETLARREQTLAELSADLDALQERMRVERTSTEKERTQLMEEIEDTRQSLQSMGAKLAEERELRESAETEIAEIHDTYRDLVDSLEGEVEAGRIELHRLRGRLQVRALDQILFSSGSAQIRPEGRDVLRKVAEQVAKVSDHRIVVEGHTDNVPIATQCFPSNWELSCARASRVARFLVESGLDPERVSASGRSEYDPIADNQNVAERGRNRRIEIVLVPDTP